MQESLSSQQTLQNYISNGQPNEQQSNLYQQSDQQCIQCQKMNHLQNQQSLQSQQPSSQSSQQQQQSQDNGQVVQPLHRHIIEHSQQIQSRINMLQEEIRNLKKANYSKDLMIQQLKRQLQKEVKAKNNIMKEKQSVKEEELLRNEQQIESLRKLVYEISQNHTNTQDQNNQRARFQMDESINQIEEIKNRIMEIEVKLEDRSGQSRKRKQQITRQTKRVPIKSIQQSSYCQNEIESIHKQSNQTHNRHPTKNKKSQSQAKTIHPKSKKQPSTQHPNTQPPQSKAFLNQQAIHTQKIHRLQSHIQLYEQQMIWMTNFMATFLKMAQKFMVNFREHQAIKEHWSLKKKTKVAWSYVKHLLHWSLQK